VSFSTFILASLLLTALPSGDPLPVDFTRDVRPILSSKCFACHGPDAEAREADLSLIDFASATRELAPGVAAIVPGDLDASEAWLRIIDDADPMPPRRAHDPLSEDEVATIRRWIESGASYRPHWAYVEPTEIARASSNDAGVVDRLLDDRHASLGLLGSDAADPVTLLRRLSFDLAGLPPSPADVDAFLALPPDERLPRTVDRLLASPHFGERLAVRWLDLVRYADTVGYHGDQEHRVWPYRDWVIRAFNAGMPFDRFTRWQLAGDLVVDGDPDLPEGDRQDALVASGYNRLVQTSHEGGLQLKEYRAIYMADRVRNTSEVWMAATVGCAQCHDHKYDPYTHVDYHAFGAFFADIDDEAHLRNPYDGYNTSPTRREPEMQVTTPDARRRLEDIARRLATAQRRLQAAETAADETSPAWERMMEARIAAGGDRTQTWVDDVLDTGGTERGDWTFHTDPAIPARHGTAYRVQRSDGLVQHYTVDTDRRIRVEPDSVLEAWIHLDPTDPPAAVMLQAHADGSWEHRARWGDDSISYGRTADDSPAYRRMGDLPPTGGWHRLEVPLAEIGLTEGVDIDGIAFTQFGGTVRWDATSVRQPGPAPPEVVEALRRPRGDRSAEDERVLAAHRRSSDPAVDAAAAALATIEAERERVVSTLPTTLYTRRLETPREVRVLPRGDWLDESGPMVAPAVPAFLGEVPRRDPGNPRADRLDLADWLVTPASEGGVGEMTARVFVNRIWAMLFGEGLCPSEEDFGGQGRPPTHAALLDLLAVDFIESGWDVKALVRRIVLTDAYARSSVPVGDTAALDPANLHYARQTRHRVDAEFVRDIALSAGGLLDTDRGGPSVKPPQPAGLYRHLNFPMRRYEPDTDDAQWRRGVYVHWQRQFLHPMLKAFDAPSREACVATRSVSNTPLAALVLMNDPVFVAAARGLARRVLADDSTASDRDRLAHAWFIALSRRPSESELMVLERLLQKSRRDFGDMPENAITLVDAAPRGESTASPHGRPPTEFAAWIQTCRAILNLHETYTRE